MKRLLLVSLSVFGIFFFLVHFGFAAISQYENPLGCDITSLPQFIKGVLTIIVKVGIPVATLFIIWSGFLFLTAQGDEAQLTKAKKAFMWACIGTAVLLGSWLLATAINATIHSLGGGTSGGGGTTIDGGPCDSSDGTGGSSDTKKTLALGAMCSVGGELNSTGSVSFAGDTMEHYGLESDDPEILSKVYKIAQGQALTESNEQAFVFVKYRGDGAVLSQTGDGSMTEVAPIPFSTIQKGIIDTAILPIESIHIIHTHSKYTVGGMTDAPPSVRDLIAGTLYSEQFDVPIIQNVADPNGVWEYSAPPSSTAGKALNFKSLGTLPEVIAAFGSGAIDPCDPDILKKIGDLPLSSSSRAVYDDYMSNAKSFDPLFVQDAKFESLLGDSATNADKIAGIMAERLATERSIGVDLKRVK